MEREIWEILKALDSKEITIINAHQKICGLCDEWVKYDFMQIETRPTKCGKHFVMRKDGKVHWENWNGNGWAYNENSITHWREVRKPKSKF